MHLAQKTAWHNIGCHATPETLAIEFSDIVAECVGDFFDKQDPKVKIKLLDLFAGDGRLGNLVGNLLSKNFNRVKLSYVEIDSAKKIEVSPLISESEIITLNNLLEKIRNK